MYIRQLAVLAIAFGFAATLGACSSSEDLSAPIQETDPTVENANPGAADPLSPEGVPDAPRDPATDPADPTAPVNPADPTNPLEPTEPADPVNPTDPANSANPADPAGKTTDDPMGNPSL